MLDALTEAGGTPVDTAAAEESLRRLRTDHTDVYFPHYQDDLTPIEESAAAFDALVRAGKVRATGLSNFTADAVREWMQVAKTNGLVAPVALQPHYRLVHRHPSSASWPPWWARTLLRCCGAPLPGSRRRLLVRHVPHRRGHRRTTPRCRRTAAARQRRAWLLDTIDAIADDHHVGAGAIALAWLLHQPSVTAPLTSATSPAQLEELIVAPKITLDLDELDRLDTASTHLA